MWGLLSPLKWSCKKWRKVILTSDLLTKQNDLGTWLQWTGCQVEQKSPRSIRLVQHPDVANAAAVGNGTCRCLAALRTSFALLGVIICCEGVLWAHLAVSTGAFPQHVTLKISCSVNLQLTPAAKGSPILSKLTWIDSVVTQLITLHQFEMIRVLQILRQLGIQPGEQLHNLFGANFSGEIWTELSSRSWPPTKVLKKHSTFNAVCIVILRDFWLIFCDFCVMFCDFYVTFGWFCVIFAWFLCDAMWFCLILCVLVWCEFVWWCMIFCDFSVMLCDFLCDSARLYLDFVWFLCGVICIDLCDCVCLSVILVWCSVIFVWFCMIIVLCDFVSSACSFKT